MYKYLPKAVDIDTTKTFEFLLNDECNWSQILWKTGRYLPRLCCPDMMQYESVKQIKEWLEKFLLDKYGIKCHIVNIWGNKYRNGDDYLPDHRDSYGELHVLSLSLGATRNFHFKKDNKIDTKFSLENGDILIFSPEQNMLYTHGISKQTSVKQERINLTCFCTFENSPYL